MDGLYTLVFHHGGVLLSDPEYSYIGGEIDAWELFDMDYVSVSFIEHLFELHWGSKQKIKEIFWLSPGCEVKDGLMHVRNDTNVRSLYKAFRETTHNTDEIHFYFAHEVSNDLPVIVNEEQSVDLGDDGTDENQNDEGDGLYKPPEFQDDDDVEEGWWRSLEQLGSQIEKTVEEDDAKCSRKGKQKWRANNGRSKSQTQSQNVKDVTQEHSQVREEQRPSLDEEEEGYKTDEMENIRCSTDDEEEEEMDRPSEFNAEAEYGNVNLELLMLFPSLQMFKEAVKDYSIALGRPLKLIKNDKVRCRMKCHEDACKWEIFCSWSEVHGSFQIKYFYHNHSCSRNLKNSLADQQWVSKKLVDRLRITPKMTSADAYNFMADSYQVNLTETKLYRAMHIAKEIVEGSEKEQFAKLWDYCAEIRSRNPGSTLQLGVNRPDLSISPKFEKLYICFGATKRGAMQGCRPLIGLDGCFLKGYYGGNLLAAVTQDANQAFYVIAYAIVEQETKDTWSFFLTRLFEDIGHPNDHGWEFISDMQKGLLPAMQELAPGVPHRFCVKHLEANLWKQWRNAELRLKLWSCAKSKTMPEFERNYQELRTMNEAAWTYLNRFPPQTWSRAAFQTGSKNWALLNNMCEQFNATIVKFREKPVLTMLEDIRNYLMNKMNKSRNQMAKYQGPIAPAAQSKLELSKRNSHYWHPLWAGDEEGSQFQVHHIFRISEKYVIDFKEQTCSCREWDLTGIPCSHVMACIGHKNDKPENYVNSYYLKETWESTYRPFIRPLRGEDQWKKTGHETILPPAYSRGGGRPKKNRTKTADLPANPFKAKRKYKTFTCAKCGSQGHNSRSCKGTTTKERPAKKTKATKDKSQGAQSSSQVVETTAQSSSQAQPFRSPTHVMLENPNDQAEPMFVPTPGLQPLTTSHGQNQWRYDYGYGSASQMPFVYNGLAIRPSPCRPPQLAPLAVATVPAAISMPPPVPRPIDAATTITHAPFQWRGQQCVTRETLLAASRVTRNRVADLTGPPAQTTRITKSKATKFSSSQESSSCNKNSSK